MSKNEYILVRMTGELKELIRLECEKSGVTLTKYMLDAVAKKSPHLKNQINREFGRRG